MKWTIVEENLKKIWKECYCFLRVDVWENQIFWNLKNFLNSISTMVHFFMWVQYIFSIKRSSFLLVCISEQDIILHQGQVLHHFIFIQKRHLNKSVQFLQKKYQGFNCACIGPTINFHPGINPKIEVDPIINGEEKYGGLYFHWTLYENWNTLQKQQQLLNTFSMGA